MRKVTSSILVGLACTSILSLSAGIPSVKADAQDAVKQTQQLKQSELQDANYSNGEIGYFNLFKGNNLENGYITNKTTQLAISGNIGLLPGNSFVLTNSSGAVVLYFSVSQFTGQIFNIPSLKAGEIYRIGSLQSPQTNYLEFSVVNKEDIGAPTINKVTSQDTTISGTGVAGATINLSIAGDTYKGTVDASGNYKISLNKSYAENSAITLYQEKNGTKSDSVTATVVAPEKLSLPTINTVTAGDRVITGIGVPRAIIYAEINGTTYVGAADQNGKFNVDIGKFPAGTVISLHQELDGLKSDSVTTTMVAPEKLPLPTINTVTAGDQKVTGTGISGATVNLTISGDTYTGTVDTSGNYNISLNKTYAVDSAITVTQEKDGITSDSVTATVVAPEKLALPTLNPVTSVDQTVTGTGVPGAILHLTINGESYLIEVGEDGKFSILTNKTYPVGSAITIYQEKDGIKSDSVTASVVAPEQLDIPTVNVVSDKDTKVTGTAAAGATVHLSINGLNFHTIASANGEFSINIEKNYPANTPIEVYQELNGVKSETATVYVKSTVNFIINKIKSNATSITGTGYPNAQITVQIDDEDFTGTVDASGNFTINLNGATFKVGTNVILTSVSSEETTKQTVQIYPQDPVIGVVFAEDDQIRGTVDPGATVIITVGAEQYQTTADSKGNFRQSVNPNLVQSGVLVTVYSNIEGYKSDEVTTTVD